MRILLIALAALVATLLLAKLRYREQAPAAQGCDPKLWDHVYESHRLEVLLPCVSVAGRVLSVHKNHDGDAHIELDPDDASVLNLINVVRMSHFVVEAVCDHPSEMKTVTAACAGFTSPIALPAVGDRIRATGVYAVDRDNGWAEIHPVSRIDLLSAAR